MSLNISNRTRGIRAVELFCGIGGFRLACDRIGIETLFANDLNPLAARVYSDRFPNHSFVLGDIREQKQAIPPHDLLTAGFPCQPFSSAGKKLGTRDARGTLFGDIVDVLRSRQPRWFVLENVKRLLTMEAGEHFLTIVSALSELGYVLEWRLLNARGFGLAQNRPRVFITGRLDSRPGLSLIQDAELSKLDTADSTLLAATEYWPHLSSMARKFGTWGQVVGGRCATIDLPSPVISSQPRLLRDVLEPVVGREFDFTESTIERLKNSERVCRFIDGVEILSNQRGGARMGYTVFGINGLAPTLTATTSRHYERFELDGRYRRLTSVEYARLQGFPDNHCAAASTYDQYGLYGNAVPPPMAEWCVGRLISGSLTACPRAEPTLFEHSGAAGE